ncbi:hypothetical protein, partial [Leyella stercorea]|uniref:hypothetical protein n=1 Tax=Leyella stercorea TaxID=363265 RepID=UPI00242BDF64
MSINNTKTTKVERFRSTFVVLGALAGGALVSSAPTEQNTNWLMQLQGVHLSQVHQPNKIPIG